MHFFRFLPWHSTEDWTLMRIKAALPLIKKWRSGMGVFQLASRIAALLIAVAPVALTANSVAAQVVYNRGSSAEPATLDPHKTTTVAEGDILRDVYEGLVAHDAKANVVPGVAESWTTSADGKVWTFKLRANAVWSNGDPVKASDFVFSLRRLVDKETAAEYASMLFPVLNAESINKGEKKLEELGVKAIDDRTLEVTLGAPTPYFLQMLTHQTMSPVHPASVAKFGKDFSKPENAVVNGPYLVKEVVPNSYVRLVKNPKFREAALVKIDVVNYVPTEDRSTGLRRFQAGEVLSYNDVPADQLKFIRANLGKQFRLAPYLGTYYFVFNTKKAPFDDVRVRKALSLVVDREFLAEEIWGGTMIPAYSMVPPGTDNYAGGPALYDFKDKTMLEREDMAKALLKAAGYGPGGKSINLEIRFNTSENHRKTSVALADMWKPLNIEVKYVNTDTKTHYAFLRQKGDFDVARAGWIADYSDPQNFLFLLESNNAALNYATYSNPAYDALMKSAGAEADIVKRAALLKQAETIMLADEPYLVLLTYSSKNLLSDKVVGWEDNALDIHPSRYLSIKP